MPSQVPGTNDKILSWSPSIETSAQQQLLDMSKLPFIHSHIAVMPDVHAGRGATIGSVIPTRDVIIPAAVGVDIGCGMNALRLNLTASDLPDSLHNIRMAIERKIPLAATEGHTDDDSITRQNAAKYLHQTAAYHGIFRALAKHPAVARITAQLGTLGSGNHFIELCLDEHDHVWIMLHSGSRGIGNAIGSHFIALAQKEMERWHIQLPNRDLAYIPEGSEHFQDYITAVEWAQDYAMENRRQMMRIVLNVLRDSFPALEITEEAINCHHNYIARENHFGANVWVTRKGAIRAREGDMGIIPGSMGTRSYIVRGKGNKASLCSCSHGAGRVMSRTEARKRFTADDLAAQTTGIECPKTEGFVDEIPSAYKDIDQVMENQRDLVDIVHTLRQVMNIKG